jgi:hypothetical protein
MATFTSTQVSSGRAHKPLIADPGVITAYGMIDIAANPADGDIYELVRLPAGATVVGGYLQAVDLDTGTEALDMDIGWAANGVDAADPDGFGNLGVLTGDAVTGIKPEAGIYYPLGGVLFSAGPKSFTNETIVQVEANAAANAGGTGKMWIVINYVM